MAWFRTLDGGQIRARRSCRAEGADVATQVDGCGSWQFGSNMAAQARTMAPGVSDSGSLNQLLPGRKKSRFGIFAILG